MSPVESGAEEGNEEGEEAAYDVRGDGEELLHDGALVGVDGGDDGRGEESEALDGDVVEEEDERGGERDGGHDTQPEFLLVDAVEDFGLADALGLDTGDGQVALLLGKPGGGRGAVSQGEEGDEGEADCDDAFDGEDHAPACEAAEGLEGEDARGEEATEGAG